MNGGLSHRFRYTQISPGCCVAIAVMWRGSVDAPWRPLLPSVQAGLRWLTLRKPIIVSRAPRGRRSSAVIDSYSPTR